MPEAVMTVGQAEKAAGDSIRMPMDFGNEPLLIQGYSIIAKNVVCPDAGAPSITGIQLDYAYQVSALISGGTAGETYGIVFTITLNDPDNSELSRTGLLKVN